MSVTAPIKDYSFKRASTIEVPDEFFHPLRTRNPAFDDLFSELGGIVPSSVTLVTGIPGSGKTTLAALIASMLAMFFPDEDFSFISLEMSDFQLKNQARKIKGFGNLMVSTEFHLRKTLEELEKKKPKLLILDSLQKAASQLDMSENRAQVEIVNTLTAWAKRTWIPVLIIGHCDKSGKYRGPSTILHEVDSHMEVKYDRELDMRTFMFGKNRFGGDLREEIFGFTRDTVWVGSPHIITFYTDAVVKKIEKDASTGSTETISPTAETIEAQIENEVFPDTPREYSNDSISMVKSCMKNLNDKWSGSAAMVTVKTVLDMIKAQDPDTENLIVPAQKIRLAFRGATVAHTHQNGEIVFGTKSMDDNFQIGRIGFSKEKPYISKWCKNRSHLLAWYVMHQYTTLKQGVSGHNTDFFARVDKLAEHFKEIFQ